jgi:hypothetical protein
MPTWYDSLTTWKHSPPVFPVTDGTQYDIHLVSFFSNVTGSGSISGNVTQSGTINSVLAGAEVLLFNPNNQVLQLTKTDISGNYSFSNLSFESYKVNVEIAGKISFPAFLTLNNLNPIASNINFVIEGNSITAINENFDLNSRMSALYPNPTREDIFIDINLQKSMNLNISILNHLGQVLQHYDMETVTGNQQIHLNTITLPEGFYTLQIISSKTAIIKKFIKIN